MPTAASRRRTGRKVESHLGEGFVEVAPGLEVGRCHTASMDLPELHAEVHVEVEWNPDSSRFEATDLAIHLQPDAPPMAEVVRLLAPKTTIEGAIRDVVGKSAWVPNTEGAWTEVGLRRLDDEDESDYVARLYRLGAVCGPRPTQFVQWALGCAPSTASAKVVLARKLGKLPPTSSGKVEV